MMEKVKSVVRVGVWLMIVGVLGYCTLAMKLLTRTSCGIFWQTTMVNAGDARKDLFKNLQKPAKVLEAPLTADNIAVDTRNNALLYSLGRWPPARSQVPSNTGDVFSYEGIMMALKTWQDVLTFVQVGVAADPSIPGYLYHCSYTAAVYQVAAAVVDLYVKGELDELAVLHNQLTAYVTRGLSDKMPYVMPSLLVRLLKRPPLDTVWLNSHPEGSNCPDTENNMYLSTTMQVTSFIFSVQFRTASITTFVMQRPMEFTDAMKERADFALFNNETFWKSTKNATRALQYTERGVKMVPTAKPSDSSNTRVAFSWHSGALPNLTPSIDELTPYDPQGDPKLIGDK